MKISFYTDYFGRCWKTFWQSYKEEHIPMFVLLVNYPWCLLRHGYLIRHYALGNFYKRREFERKRIMTYRRYLRAQNYFNDIKDTHVLENKHEFNGFFSGCAHHSWLYSPETSLMGFDNLLRDEKILIVKSYNTHEGEGAHKTYSDKVGDVGILPLYRKLNKGRYMIEEYIVQDLSLYLGSTSVNTLRVETLLNKKTNKSYIMKVLFRTGVGHTDIDNYAQGGCVYEMGLATGRAISSVLSRVSPNVLFHPGTNTFMLGFQVPCWNKTVKTCNSIQEKLRMCGFVSWDAAISVSGECELVEGNHNPDYELLEFKGIYRYWEKVRPYMH